MRIITGSRRGRKLKTLPGDAVRPTPDRVRETLFNWLGQDLDGQHCLDLFAGTGILGFEAASRGAAGVVLVERDARALDALHKSAKTLQASQVEIVRGDAVRFAQTTPRRFDGVFLDPPYKQGWIERVAPWLDRIVQPENRRHRTLAFRHGRLHGFSAQTHQLHGIGKRDGTGNCECRVFTQRMASRHGRGSPSRGTPGTEHGHAGSQHQRLGIDGGIDHCSISTFLAHRPQILPKRTTGLIKGLAYRCIIGKPLHHAKRLRTLAWENEGKWCGHKEFPDQNATQKRHLRCQKLKHWMAWRSRQSHPTAGDVPGDHAGVAGGFP